MLGSIYGGTYPYQFPETTKSDAMSENEQFSIIDRAINGDLKGIVSVTQSDIDLYNHHKAMQENYANEYRKATEFSYIPRSQQEKVKAERAAQMGITPPHQSAGFSSSNYMEAKPLYPQQPSNPVLSGYASFNSTPAYAYPNTYFGNGYYPYYNNGYYNSYYQQPQQIYDYGDPVTNYAVSKIAEMSNLSANGYFDNNYYGGYYNQYPYTREVAITIDPNQRPSQTALNFGNISNQSFINNQTIPIDDIPEGFEKPVVIHMSEELRNSLYNNYYSGMSPYQRMFNSPPPYAQTKQYQDYVASIQRNNQNLMEVIQRSVLGHKGVDYDEYMEQKKIETEESVKRSYIERHKYDAMLNPIEIKIKAEQDENMGKVMANFRANPYNISFDQSKTWERVEAALMNDRQFQIIQEYMPSDMSFVEFLAKGYPSYVDKRRYDDFRRTARLESMQYDSSKYRNAIDRSGINGSPYLGFKPIYNPYTGQQSNAVTPPESISQKYNERRASYIREAEKRGGIV